MAQRIIIDSASGLPIRGSLDGTFEDALNYLDWSINVFAGKGNMDTAKKGKAFADAVQVIKQRFGMGLSTHYLKQNFCQDRKHKNNHITYMLDLAGYQTEPTKTSFKGGIVNGRRCIVPKIFDFLVTQEEAKAKEQKLEVFKEKCIAEWQARDKALEEQKLNASKLQIVSALAEEEVSSTEMEELAPDLKKQDIQFQKEIQVLSQR